MVALAAAALADGQHNNQGRRLRNGRRFQGQRRPVPVQNSNPFVPAVPVADPVPVQVVNHRTAVAPVAVRSSVRQGKSIDVEGSQFFNQSPDEFGNYNFR